MAFLSFDKHDAPDELHPLKLTEEICAERFEKQGFKIKATTTGGGAVLKTYGHGEYCLNYWLEKNKW
jgi:hypothetical protein